MNTLSHRTERSMFGRVLGISLGLICLFLSQEVSAQKKKTTSSDLERNKELVRSFFRATESGDFGDNFDKIVAEDYKDHLRGQEPGRDNLKAYLKGVRNGFPDMKWPIYYIIAEGDLVVVFNSFEATHANDFGPWKATGKRVKMDAFQLYRIVDGKLAEHWEIPDLVTLQKQLESK
ncbi:MAG: ester cyclase [Cyclobacteriaceae bacterium]|nr:ester cyclase [Cyclobacteriaceae bacterium]